MNDLEKLIELAKIVSKPWVIATSVLSALLGISVAGNIYMSLSGVEVTISADNNIESVINQSNE